MPEKVSEFESRGSQIAIFAGERRSLKDPFEKRDLFGYQI